MVYMYLHEWLIFVVDVGKYIIPGPCGLLGRCTTLTGIDQHLFNEFPGVHGPHVFRVNKHIAILAITGKC